MKRVRRMLEKVAGDPNWAVKRILATDVEVKRLKAVIRKVLRDVESDVHADDDYHPYDELRAALKPVKK